MLKNYLVIALRHHFGNKSYFFINTIGLSTGIACCLLSFLFVRHEWTYDAFHEKSDRIYRVLAGRVDFDDNPSITARTPLPLASTLNQQYPDILRTVRIRHNQFEIRIGGDTYQKEDALFCDPSFFRMFSFSMIEGDPGTALSEVNSVVVSKSAAAKYFGQESPLGKQLMVGDVPLTVTGVAENGPDNSSIRFDLLIPFDKISKMVPWIRNAINRWNYSVVVTFIELADPAQAESIASQLPDFVETHFPAFSSPNLILQPITDIYLNPEVNFGLGPTSDPILSYILICTALLVLFIACVNFMNLAVCRSSSRVKEVGLRKVYGAQRTQIMGQHLGETTALCCFALMLGVALAHLFLPVFNMLAGKSLILDYLTSGPTLAALFGLTALIVLVSGIYPSVVLSRNNPIAIFRRQFQIGRPNLLVHGLMVVQFGLSVLIVISILIMSRQLDFVRSVDLGFNQQNVVVIQAPFDSNDLEVFRNKVLPYEDILLVSGASSTIGQGRGVSKTAYSNRDGNELEAFMFTVDYSYLKTLELDLVSGRDFSREFGTDEAGSCIINEAATRRMEWEDPLGRKLPHGYTVIGVVKDYHFQSMHREIEPVILALNPTARGNTSVSYNYVLARVSGKDIPAALSLLEDAWKETAPETPYEYFFLEDDIERFYLDENNLARIFRYSAVFALLIACLGVYGLVSLDMARRAREVVIRKVMGAAVSDIMGLLSKPFVYLVLIANVLAWSAAWWLMNEWLADFAYRADIGAGPFILAGLVVLAIIMLTVSMQTFRSALINPADILRRE